MRKLSLFLMITLTVLSLLVWAPGSLMAGEHGGKEHGGAEHGGKSDTEWINEASVALEVSHPELAAELVRIAAAK